MCASVGTIYIYIYIKASILYRNFIKKYSCNKKWGKKSRKSMKFSAIIAEQEKLLVIEYSTSHQYECGKE
jgi:hypothetical protein